MQIGGGAASKRSAEKLPLFARLKKFVVDSPAWAISIGLHLVVVLIASLVYFEQLMSDDEGKVTINIGRAEAPKLVDLEGPGEETEETDSEAESDATDVDDDLQSDAASGDDASALGGGGDEGVVLGVVGDDGSGRKVSTSISRPRRAKSKQRQAKAEEKPPLEESILAALKWLARHQNADGSWSVTQFHRNCGAAGYRGDCAANHFEGNDQFDTGVTGLAVLAFLGAGHTPASRELVSPEDESTGELGAVLGAARAATYGDVVRKGVKHLLRSQGSSGMIGPEVDRAIYNHLIATLALSETYGITRAPVLRGPVARAIAYTVKARSPRLGWRYAFQAPEADSSVTGWAVMALRSAETAGIPVEPSVRDEVARWFEGLTVKAIVEPKLLRAAASPEGESHWLTAYSRPDDAGKLVTVPGLNDDYYFTPASTAIMIMAQRLLGRPLSNKGERGLQTVLAFPPEKWSPDDRSSWKQADFYYWYHATFALAQIAESGDERWRRWSEGVEAALLSTQNLGNARGECREGSWEPVDRWSCEGGRVYATALGALTLEVHFRLPLLLAQKKNTPTLQLR